MTNDFSRREFIAATGAGLGLMAAAPAALADPPAGKLPKRTLGKTGLSISIVCFGAGSRYLANKDPDEQRKLIDRAIELGINYFDTAYIYGDDCESVKRFAKYLVPKYRKQIVLSSKIIVRDAETAKRQLDEMLTLLKIDHFDLLHYHSVNKTEDIDQLVGKGGAQEVFLRAKEQGVVKHVAMSGHQDPAVLLDGIRRLKPEVVMCPLNPAHLTGGYAGGPFGKAVIPAVQQRGIGLLAMKTTGQLKLIDRGGVSAETLVRYAISLPVAGAVIGMCDLKVLESCVAMARGKPMSAEERAAAEKAIDTAPGKPALSYLAPGYVDGCCRAT